MRVNIKTIKVPKYLLLISVGLLLLVGGALIAVSTNSKSLALGRVGTNKTAGNSTYAGHVMDSKKVVTRTVRITSKENTTSHGAIQTSSTIKDAAPVQSNKVSTTPTVNNNQSYQVNEQFSGTTLNPSLWQAMTRPKGYRNSEEQDYLPSQVAVSNGTLQITAQKDVNGNWHSGEVDSKWSYKYGTFEVRLALSATGSGVWPAAWLLGTTDNWPNGGELDMIENVNGDNNVYGTIHGGGTNGVWQLQKQVGGIDITKYHVYKLVKQPNDVSWYIDGAKQAEWTPSQMPQGAIWPFESHANMAILNLAIGGSWPGPSNASTPNTVTMYVDYFTVKGAY